MNARRRLMVRRWVLIGVATVALAVLIAADRLGLLLVNQADDMAAYHGRTVEVVRVIDGDTIEIDAPDAHSGQPTTTVRLWGLDAPETAHDDQSGEPLAERASQFARETIGDSPVAIWLESHRTRGSFGRVLAHVELADGRVLNALLLEAGLAHLEERWAHDRLVFYDRKQRLAQQAEVGLWAEED